MELATLKVPQQVFVVFYAIIWGTLANALPRWRAFDKGRVPRSRTAFWCFVLSTVLLNVLPIGYFVWVLSCRLSSPAWALAGWGSRAFWEILAVAICALAPFGFYRVWLYFVQARWSQPCFYPSNWRQEAPGLQANDLDHESATGNLLFGLLYILASLLAPVAVVGLVE